MKKKVLYIILGMFVDLVVLNLISFLAVLLIKKNPYEYDWIYFCSFLIISIVKLTISCIFKSYHLIWKYSIRRNLLRLVLITLSIDVFFLLLSMIPTLGEATGIKTSIYISIMFHMHKNH